MNHTQNRVTFMLPNCFFNEHWAVGVSIYNINVTQIFEAVTHLLGELIDDFYRIYTSHQF
ncbi:hypothetical protein A1332_08180 [Methylomonas methanica]|uniref:Uncharacterized protein n=1 Tax=Methylomonas methanica TaxID=421 RepID=A0A177MRZ3_METMH|nr:hypothetical protein A1332_08180 [Methylomonas methanica]